jgi:RNA polymerase sigma-70 factor (ECF subfamily)
MGTGKGQGSGSGNSQPDQEQRWRAGMLAAQSGDGDAYQKLLEGLLPVVRSLVRVRLPDPALAEDVVQNALLSIHRARHTYRPERPFGPWMRTIVRNASIDALRDQSRRKGREADLDIAELPADPVAEWQPDAGGLSPELARALEELPAKQREAVVMIQLEGLSVAEAAARADVSPGALRVRAHRGYRSLRAQLERRGRQP